jgi:signal transduction histidine kinase
LTARSRLPPAPDREAALDGAIARSDGLGNGAIILGGAGLTALAVAITIAGNGSDYAWLEGVARGLLVATPIAVGLYARHRAPFARFGALLIATGVVAFGTTLAEASAPAPYAIGRLAGWMIEPLVVYAVLAFPTGRLQGRTDRALVWATLGVALGLYVPTALVVERFPEPVHWTLCHGGCPDNPFMVTGSEPAAIEDLVRPLRELLIIVLFATVALRLVQRLRGASGLLRRTLEPVLGVAVFRFAAFAVLLGLRAAAPESDAMRLSLWTLSLSIPLLAAAFLVGLIGWRLFIADAVEHVATRLTAHPEPDDVRAGLAEAFDDPQLGIAYWLDERQEWVDGNGETVAVPRPGPGRWLTEVRDEDRLVAGIVHDEVLRDETAFIDAATTYAVMTFDNHRLSTEAAALLGEVQASRARIQATADEERRRIERDLHDGAQQRLVALRIKLELAAERLDGSDGGSAELLRQLGSEIDGALDEVRSLARGIYPSPLSDRGLTEALRSAALQAVLPTTVLASGVRKRYPHEIETAAYFCCLEALQNAGKHAGGATAVVIELSGNGSLRFEVRDDGAGFDTDAAEPGVGLVSMRDRLAAVHGELAIVSARGKGTRVVGTIPLSTSGGAPGLTFRAASALPPTRRWP